MRVRYTYTKHVVFGLHASRMTKALRASCGPSVHFHFFLLLWGLVATDNSEARFLLAGESVMSFNVPICSNGPGKHTLTAQSLFSSFLSVIAVLLDSGYFAFQFREFPLELLDGPETNSILSNRYLLETETR